MKRIWLFLLVFAFAQSALAHGNLYYDYSPDPWKSERFVVSTASSVEQVFQLRDEVELLGLDVWLDNTGSSGSVSFSISNALGTVLLSQTETLGKKTAVAGGNRFHLDFDQALELSAGKTYTLKISSGLLGLGLYYADSFFTFLTHNEAHISEYLLGKARIDGVDQDFTFKYALFGNVIEQASEGSGQVQEQEETPEEEVVVSNSDIVIFDARVVDVDGGSVTIAWSTNLAADSGVTIREQLNPLYVISSAFDPLLELEHTLKATGLRKSTLYFADVYSATPGSEAPVNTYSIAFQTTNEAVPASTSEEESLPSETQAPTEGSETAQNESLGEEIEADEDGALIYEFSEEEEVEVSSEAGLTVNSDGSLTISWGSGSSGSGGGGYRIDIFDQNNNLIRQIELEGDVQESTIADLAKGVYRVVVYEKGKEAFKKVAASDFSLEQVESSSRLRGAYIVFSVAIVIALLAWLLYRKRHALDLKSK